jgi:hypothetical protein
MTAPRVLKIVALALLVALVAWLAAGVIDKCRNGNCWCLEARCQWLRG